MPGRQKRLLIATLTVLLAGLGAGSLWTARLVAAAERQHPPTGDFVEADGGQRLHYREWAGDGPTVVLLHGAFGGIDDWDHSGVAAALAARGLRVLAFDRPGHGHSEAGSTGTDPASQAGRLLDAAKVLGATQPIVVGFSFGGAVALAWALTAPEPPRALVLLNPATHPWRTGYDPAYDLVHLPVLGDLLAATWLTPVAGSLAAGSLAKAFTPEPLLDRFAALSPWRMALRPASFRRNAAEVRDLEPFLDAWHPRYAELEMPIEILASRDDQVVSPILHARRVASAVGTAELEELTGVGHQLPWTRTDAVVDAVLRAAARAAR
jgi:pimeloyl-ACP methyl ester carboxylesterase